MNDVLSIFRRKLAISRSKLTDPQINKLTMKRPFWKDFPSLFKISIRKADTIQELTAIAEILFITNEPLWADSSG